MPPQPFFEPRGTPISVFQRLEALSKLGHQVDLLTYHIGQDIDFEGLSIHRIPNIPFIKHVRIGPSWSKLLLDIFIFGRAFMMLLTRRYDIIHSHEEAGFLVMLWAKLFRTAHIYDMHSSLPHQLNNFKFANYWPIISLFKVLEHLVLYSCEGLITIGADLEQYAHQINPKVRQIRIENFSMLKQAASMTEASTELKYQLHLEDKPIVVYTGTFEQYQGLDMLLECAQLIIEKRPDTMFILVGGNPEQVKFWRSQANKHNLSRNALFIGQVSPAKASMYQNMADILVSPRIEGTSVPLKIYGYLFAAKPIVATDIPAHTQVLNPDTALLVPPQAKAFATGILSLLENPTLAKTLGKQAKIFAQKEFNPEQYLVKLNHIYQAVSQSIPLVSINDGAGNVTED